MGLKGPKSITPVSPHSKSVRTWRGKKSVVSCPFPNSITMTSWQQVGNLSVYREVTGKRCLMDFGHYQIFLSGFAAVSILLTVLTALLLRRKKIIHRAAKSVHSVNACSYRLCGASSELIVAIADCIGLVQVPAERPYTI